MDKVKETSITSTTEAQSVVYLYETETENKVEMPVYLTHFAGNNNHKVIQLSGPYIPEILNKLFELTFVSKIELYTGENLERVENDFFQIQKCEAILRKHNNNVIIVSLCSYTPDAEEE